jgi:serine/threonine protein kinase
VLYLDLKPENTSIAADGTLRIADFGISITMAQARAI